MLARFDSYDLTEFQEYEKALDFPDGYHAAGVVGAAVVNSALGSKGKATPADFVPYYAAPAASAGVRRRMSGDEMLGNLRAHDAARKQGRV